MDRPPDDLPPPAPDRSVWAGFWPRGALGVTLGLVLGLLLAWLLPADYVQSVFDPWLVGPRDHFP